MSCTADNCARPEYCRSLCRMHYKRWWRHGDPEHCEVRTYAADDVCENPVCDNPPKKAGLCQACWTRKWRKGYIERDIAPQGSGTINGGGYKVLTIDGKRVYEHRLVMEKKLGRKLRAEEVVHHQPTAPLDRNHSDDLELFANQAEHARYHAIKRGE